MRAVVWHARGDVRFEEVADAPPPARGELGLDIEWCGICGTDLEEWRSGPHFIPTEPHPLSGRSAPLVLGHEISARIREVGDGVRGFAPGDLVAVDGILSCGQCWWCRRHRPTICESLGSVGLHADGGLAEAITVPAEMCVRVPDSIDSATAALAEPLAVAVRALRRGRLQLGESVAVIGAGTIGLCTLATARAGGASTVVVVDPVPQRRELAARLGASAVFDPQDDSVCLQVREATHGRGADLVVEAAGTTSSVPLALECARRGGRIVIVGLAPELVSLDLFAIAAGEKEIIGSLSHVWDEDFAGAVRLLADGVLTADQVVTRRIPLESTVAEGFHALAHNPQDVKILVGPHLVP